MKYFLTVILSVSFLLFSSGCEKAIDDSIDCIVESTLLSVTDEVDETNPKLIHFEFVNNDTDGRFTLDQPIVWDFGDGNTGNSTNNKIDHTYSDAGSYTVKASYTLRNGSSSCRSTKDKSVTVN